MRRRLALLALTVALLGLAVACGSDAGDAASTTTEGAPVTGQLTGVDWVLDPAASSVDLPDGVGATLTVDTGTVSGVGPCNSFRGSLQVDGSSITIGSLAETAMACEPDVQDAQDAYTAALRAVNAAEVDGDTLVLTGVDDTRLTFTASDPARAVLGTWDIVEVAKPDAIVSIREGTAPTLTFAADGSMAVDTSCNTGGGPYEVDGSAITIGPVAVTERACLDPEGVMRQETRILVALGNATAVEATPQRLTLLDNQGFILLGAVPAG